MPRRHGVSKADGPDCPVHLVETDEAERVVTRDRRRSSSFCEMKDVNGDNGFLGCCESGLPRRRERICNHLVMNHLVVARLVKSSMSRSRIIAETRYLATAVTLLSFRAARNRKSMPRQGRRSRLANLSFSRR